MSDFFLSHVEDDRELAFAVAAALEAVGLSTWYYERDSLPGRTYLEQVANALKSAHAVLVLISRAALQSPQVRNEVTTAYELNKPFLPVLLNISHDVFQNNQIFRQAIGAATSISVSEETMREALPRIVAGAECLLRGEKEHNGQMVRSSSSPTLPNRRFVRKLIVVCVSGGALVFGLIFLTGNFIDSRSPLDRMEQFRERAEDCLSTVEWPDGLQPILGAWEREALNLDDAVLRSNVLTEIRSMKEKAKILAKPAIQQSLQKVADQVANARAHTSNTRKQ
ncbi:MAG: toll/interleukin-1 receptor domain-containing protein [Limisphaerales bacterium]